MSKVRLVLVVVALTSLTAAVMAVVGLATNQASDMEQWPAPFDLIQRHAWRTLGIGVAVSIVLGVVMFFISRSGPQPASKHDVTTLHDRFDVLEIRTDSDSRMERLPPYAYELLMSADAGSRDRVWQLIAPFTDDAVNPRALAEEWAASPPAVLDDIPVVARLTLAELFIAYGQSAAAIGQLRSAIERGAHPRAYWLFRIAKLHGEIAAEDSTEFVVALTEVDRIDPTYPLARAIRATDEAAWEQVVRDMAAWHPARLWEQNTALLFRALALDLLGRLDEAIAVLNNLPDDRYSTGRLIMLSRLLRARAVQRTGDGKLIDARHAVKAAVRARNLRRTWRGDSAEATTIAAEAALTADDSPLVWTLTRPAPDGQATDEEAADLRVIPLAAIGAALTCRIEKARELVPEQDGYARRRVLADIASATSDESVVEAWRSLLAVARTDEEKLYALRGMATEGVTDNDALDELRTRQPRTVADVEMVTEIHAISSTPEREMRLRELETVNPLASVERADLIRHDNPGTAAQLLLDAAERWQDPRLRLLAMSCYEEAGMLPEAEQVAHRLLSLYGSSWAGRTTVLQRLYNIQNLRLDWSGAVDTARTLLGLDPDDQDVRWSLVAALHNDGDPEEAWRTLNRPGTRPAPTTASRALLLLDLVRRYAPADEVARTALDTLRSFADAQQVHAAAIHAVTMRADRTDLPDEIGTQVTAAWQAFLDRYPDNPYFTAHAVDPDNPLAPFEDNLRRQADAYNEVLRLVREENRPLGALDNVVAKPYAAIFLYRPLGYHRMVFPGPQDQAVELDLARSAIDGDVLVDASALYTLTLLPELTQKLLALIFRPTVTDTGLRDLLDTNDLVAMPSSGTLAYDTRDGRTVAYESDPATVARQRDQARAMLTAARALRRITHPELIHLPSPPDKRQVVWALTLDAAKHHGIPLWADDTGLRRLAHTMGIKTFSTHALLTIAGERNRIDQPTAREAHRALLREYTVDLPYDHELLTAVATEQNWEPRSVATVLSRGATWVHARQALPLFLQGFRNAPDNNAATTWAYAAISGNRDLTGADNATERLTMLVLVTLASAADQPERLPTLVPALEAAAPDLAETVIHAAFDQLWSKTAERLPVEQAVTAFLGIISHFDEKHRLYCTQLILDP